MEVLVFLVPLALLLGTLGRRTPREIAVAAIGSVVVTVAVAAVLIAYVISQLSSFE